eukprot:GABV01009159.1.p1 GENE.GABV01009159.1~~GABV01009159.1.p1  ORF type:complete len:256 (+),score=98.39 GABV01009159.1:6-773(+)
MKIFWLICCTNITFARTHCCKAAQRSPGPFFSIFGYLVDAIFKLDRETFLPMIHKEADWQLCSLRAALAVDATAVATRIKTRLGAQWRDYLGRFDGDLSVQDFGRLADAGLVDLADFADVFPEQSAGGVYLGESQKSFPAANRSTTERQVSLSSRPRQQTRKESQQQTIHIGVLPHVRENRVLVEQIFDSIQEQKLDFSSLKETTTVQIQTGSRAKGLLPRSVVVFGGHTCQASLERLQPFERRRWCLWRASTRF